MKSELGKFRFMRTSLRNLRASRSRSGSHRVTSPRADVAKVTGPRGVHLVLHGAARRSPGRALVTPSGIQRAKSVSTQKELFLKSAARFVLVPSSMLLALAGICARAQNAPTQPGMPPVVVAERPVHSSFSRRPPAPPPPPVRPYAPPPPRPRRCSPL